MAGGVHYKPTTSISTVNMLRLIFSRWGISEELVSDNGLQFTSAEFEQFTAHLGIRHKRGAPYHPATNGLAERFVQTVKCALKASQLEGLDLRYRLNKFLMAYRNAPHSGTGQSPAQSMMGRSLRSLDCLKLVIGSKQSLLIPVVEGIREFKSGDPVWVRCYLGAIKWKQGTIKDKIGILCYEVVVDGRVWKRHIDQLKNCVQKADSILPNVGSRPDISELASDQLPLYYRNDEYFLNSDVERLPDFTQVNSHLPAST